MSQQSKVNLMRDDSVNRTKLDPDIKIGFLPRVIIGITIFMIVKTIVEAGI